MCVDRQHLPILELLHTIQTVININFISMSKMAISWTAQETQVLVIKLYNVTCGFCSYVLTIDWNFMF